VPIDESDDSFDMFDNIIRQDARSGPCEDDYETTCPFIDILPDETHGEDVSPLRF
jgi:hypothetical protein